MKLTDRLLRRDPERRALRALARGVDRLPARRRPDESLQLVVELVVDLAREMTRAKYGALAVTDEHDMTQGFVTSGLSKDDLRGLRTPPQAHGPLSSLRVDGRPVRFDNVQLAPRAFGFPPHHPLMEALIGVPIWSGGHVRGSLYVTDRADGKPFDDRDERTLVTLARHASTVIALEWY